MTDDERFGLVHSLRVVVLRRDFTRKRDERVPAHVLRTAGRVKGVPDLVETDAGLGIAHRLGGRKGDTATKSGPIPALRSRSTAARSRRAAACASTVRRRYMLRSVWPACEWARA